MSSGFGGAPVGYAGARPQSNGLGIAGFVISIVGFVTCGLVSPVGLVLSAVGLRREPRGLAIAGLVLGILGSLWMVLGGLAFGAALVGIGAAAKGAVPTAATLATLGESEVAIEKYRSEHNGQLPDDWKAVVSAAGAKTTDAWGHEIRFKKTASGYELRSAGPDGVFDNADDLKIGGPGASGSGAVHDTSSSNP